MATTYVPPADGGIIAHTGRLVSRSGKYWLAVRVQGDVVCFPPGGAGTLAGEYPDGLTTIEGVPVAATVVVRYRAAILGSPGDGAIVAQTMSAPDGTWAVAGLNLGLRYNVEARHDDHNDALVANVQPVMPP